MPWILLVLFLTTPGWAAYRIDRPGLSSIERESSLGLLIPSPPEGGLNPDQASHLLNLIHHWVSQNKLDLGLSARTQPILKLTRDRVSRFGRTVRLQQVVEIPNAGLVGAVGRQIPIFGAEIILGFSPRGDLSWVNSSLVDAPKIRIDMKTDLGPVTSDDIVNLYRTILRFRLKHLADFVKKKGDTALAVVTKRKSDYERLLKLANADLVKEMSRPETPMGRLMLKAFQTPTVKLLEFFGKRNQLQVLVVRAQNRKWNVTWRINFPFHIPVQIDLAQISNHKMQVTRVVSLEHNVQIQLYTPDESFPMSAGQEIFLGDHLTGLTPNLSKDLVDGPAQDAFKTLSQVVELFKTKFGWNSFDGLGSPLEATISIQDEMFIENAAWATAPYSRFFFGAGTGRIRDFERAVDVVAHELTHAVVENTSALDHVGESSAINEHLADILGVYVESQIRGQPMDFLLGESVLTAEYKKSLLLTEKRDVRAIRDLLEPGLSLQSQPRNWSEIPKEFRGGCIPIPENDNCGAHLLNGVLNRALSRTLQQSAPDILVPLLFEVGTERLRVESDFRDYVRQVLGACREVQNQDPNLCQRLRTEFSAVGL